MAKKMNKNVLEIPADRVYAAYPYEHCQAHACANEARGRAIHSQQW